MTRTSRSSKPAPSVPPSAPPFSCRDCSRGEQLDCSIYTPLLVTHPGAGGTGREGVAREPSGGSAQARAAPARTRDLFSFSPPRRFQLSGPSWAMVGKAPREKPGFGIASTGRWAVCGSDTAFQAGEPSEAEPECQPSHSRGWFPEPRGSGAFSASTRDCSSLGLAVHARPAELPSRRCFLSLGPGELNFKSSGLLKGNELGLSWSSRSLPYPSPTRPLVPAKPFQV